MFSSFCCVSNYSESKLYILLALQQSGPQGCKHLARVLLQKFKVNVVSVDWQKGAEPPLDQAIANARVVGMEIVYFIKVLKEHLNIQPDNIHLVGHGVGAHIAAYVGHAHQGIKKITGLDPTGPRFQGMPDPVHLNPNSASYVEVIHTDYFNSRSQGTDDKWGHADFYINNLELQPGCHELSNYTNIVKVDRDAINPGEVLPGCSHKRAFKYFIESIENTECLFLGVTCSNYQNFEKGLCVSCDSSKDAYECISFGLKTYNVPLNHSYYLNTFHSPPYCLHTYSVSVKLGEEGSQTGIFDMILEDDKSHVANASVVDVDSEIRTFSSKTNNTFLYYAPAPKLENIIKARIKWTVKGNPLCFILCKKKIHVKEITVHLLTETTAKEKNPVSRLCPVGGNTEIRTDTYAIFETCDEGSEGAKGAKRKC